MTSHDEQLLALIDQRIRLHRQRTETLGTCQQRDATGPGAQVRFDGATVAVPVKVFGHVHVQAGMRCALDKYGSEWIVTGSWGTSGFGRESIVVFAGTEQTTSSSFADLTSVAPFTFVKMHTGTFVDIAMSVSAYSSAAGGTQARWALRFTQTDGDVPYTPTDLTTNYLWFSLADTRFYQTTRFISSAVIPAGTYSVQVRWRRSGGSGTVHNVTDNDHYSVTLQEVVKTSSPYV